MRLAVSALWPVRPQRMMQAALGFRHGICTGSHSDSVHVSTGGTSYLETRSHVLCATVESKPSTARPTQISLALLPWHLCRNGQAQRRALLHNNISPFGASSPLPAPPSSHKHLDARPAQPAQPHLQQSPTDPSASHQQAAAAPFGRSTLQASTSGRGLGAEGGSGLGREAAADAQGQQSGLGGAGMVSAGRRQGQLQPGSRQTSLGPGGGAGKCCCLQLLGWFQLAGS